METTISVRTQRVYEGKRAGFYLSVFENCGSFMEPRMTALCGGDNKSAHMVSTVDDFGDLVCVHRFD